MHNILTLPSFKTDTMGPELNSWCKYHKIRVHHTNDFYQLKKQIKWLMEEGHLKNYVNEGSQHVVRSSKTQGHDHLRSLMFRKNNELERRDNDRLSRHTLNIID